MRVRGQEKWGKRQAKVCGDHILLGVKIKEEGTIPIQLGMDQPENTGARGLHPLMQPKKGCDSQARIQDGDGKGQHNAPLGPDGASCISVSPRTHRLHLSSHRSLMRTQRTMPELQHHIEPRDNTRN